MKASLSVDAGEGRSITISSQVAPNGPDGQKQQVLEFFGPTGDMVWSLAWLVAGLPVVSSPTVAIPVTMTIAGGTPRQAVIVNGKLTEDVASDEPLFEPADAEVLDPFRDLMKTIFAPRDGHDTADGQLPMVSDDDALGTVSSTVQIGAAVGAAVGGVAGSPAGPAGFVEGAAIGAVAGGWIGLEVGVAVVVYQALSE